MNTSRAAATSAEGAAGLSGASTISATGRMSASTEIRPTRAASAMLMERRKMSTDDFPATLERVDWFAVVAALRMREADEKSAQRAWERENG